MKHKIMNYIDNISLKLHKKYQKSIKISSSLKFVSATFLLVCFVCLKERARETKKELFSFLR